MDLGLEGTVALVLGGSGGLGSAIGTTLAGEGARVALGGRNADRIAAVAAAITAAGGEALPLTWNLADTGVIDQQVSRIEEHWGPVDILISNTGGGPKPSPVSGIDAQTWLDAFHSMVLPVIAMADRVLPAMRRAHWGRIITGASSGVIAPIPNLGVSNTLRSALVGWSKTLAAEEACHGITANVLVPGRIGTARVAILDEQRAQQEGISAGDVRIASTGSIPIGRYGDPEEYASAAAFLASTSASYITGSVMRVDGGYIPSV